MRLTKKTMAVGVLAVIVVLLLITPIDFIRHPSISGAAVTRVFVTGIDLPSECNYTLAQGRNLIGIPCIPQNTSVSAVFAPVISSVDSVHTYDASSNNDPWSVYNPNLPSWVVNDLQAVQDFRGYWVYTSSADAFGVNGTTENPKVVNLVQGWNLVSYVKNESDAAAVAFSTIDGLYTKVFAFNESTSQFEVYVPGLGNNTLLNISPTRGYWINMTQNATWIIS